MATTSTTSPPLTATYVHLSPAQNPEEEQASAEHNKIFSHDLPNLFLSTETTATTEDRTAFLSALRGKAAQLQGEINVFLTAKMEEDNNRAKGGDGAAGRKKTQDEKEEENYGEEVVDEED